jgi:hypothetical protein
MRILNIVVSNTAVIYSNILAFEKVGFAVNYNCIVYRIGPK